MGVLWGHTFPYDLIAPDLRRFSEPSLCAFIEANFEELTPYMNWFTAEVIYHHGAQLGIEFIEKYASKRLPSSRVIEELSGSNRFNAVILNNAGPQGYIEVQSKSGFIESVRRFIVTKALGSGASPAEVAHLCGASLRTIQRLQRSTQS